MKCTYNVYIYIYNIYEREKKTNNRRRIISTERRAHVTFTSRHIIAETGRRPIDMATNRKYRSTHHRRCCRPLSSKILLSFLLLLCTSLYTCAWYYVLCTGIFRRTTVVTDRRQHMCVRKKLLFKHVEIVASTAIWSH